MSCSPRCDGTDNAAPSGDDGSVTPGHECGWWSCVQGRRLGRTSRSATVRCGAPSRGTRDETHFALWKGHDDAAFAQRLQHRPGDLAGGEGVVLDAYPGTHSDAHRALTEKDRLDERSGVLQHA